MEKINNSFNIPGNKPKHRNSYIPRNVIPRNHIHRNLDTKSNVDSLVPNAT